MATDNPKISAYVPKAVYDRFILFKEENDLSMSQAVIKILSEYFSISIGSDIPNEFTSSLPSRLESLEFQLNELRHSHNLLFEQVNSIQSTSELLNIPVIPNSVPLSDLPDNLLNNDNLNETISSELNGELLGELPLNNLISSEPISSILGETPLNISGEPNSGILDSVNSLSEDEQRNQLLNSFRDNPLAGKYLTIRLKLSSNAVLSNKKCNVSAEKFLAWSQDKDIDGIGWISVGVGRSSGYTPHDDTPFEKLQALDEWIKANTKSPTTSINHLPLSYEDSQS